VLTDKWSAALLRCEKDNAAGGPPVDCSTDPTGRIAKAKTKAGRLIQKCTSFAGIPGCATAGSAAAVQACMEAAVGSVIEPYVQGVYP
jgi:hypothetical protein